MRAAADSLSTIRVDGGFTEGNNDATSSALPRDHGYALRNPWSALGGGYLAHCWRRDCCTGTDRSRAE